MTCPHCHHSFPLTWGRYARSPLGRHTCPSCHKLSKFKLTLAYCLLVVVSWVALFALIFGLTALLLPRGAQVLGLYYFLGLYLIGLVFLIPLNRFYDEKFRKLEKVDDTEAGDVP